MLVFSLKLFKEIGTIGLIQSLYIVNFQGKNIRIDQFNETMKGRYTDKEHIGISVLLAYELIFATENKCTANHLHQIESGFLQKSWDNLK